LSSKSPQLRRTGGVGRVPAVVALVTDFEQSRVSVATVGVDARAGALPATRAATIL
jgi:hypothetical protein